MARRPSRAGADRAALGQAPGAAVPPGARKPRRGERCGGHRRGGAARGARVAARPAPGQRAVGAEGVRGSPRSGSELRVWCAAGAPDARRLRGARRRRRVGALAGDGRPAAEALIEALTAGGGEGMVVKPKTFVARGRKGLVQPGIKCRGREYLRIIYGPSTSTRVRSPGCTAAASVASVRWPSASSASASRRRALRPSRAAASRPRVRLRGARDGDRPRGPEAVAGVPFVLVSRARFRARRRTPRGRIPGFRVSAALGGHRLTGGGVTFVIPRSSRTLATALRSPNASSNVPSERTLQSERRWHDRALQWFRDARVCSIASCPAAGPRALSRQADGAVHGRRGREPRCVPDVP